METLQLSVLDLPPQNVLGTLPRFSINGKDSEAIAQLAKVIGEIRLDQVEPQRAGNGKSENQLQPNLPITIKPSATHAIAPSIEDSYEFKVGDRIKFRDVYRTNWDIEKRIGSITEDIGYGYRVLWDGCQYDHVYTKFHIHGNKWWEKCPSIENVSGINIDVKPIPETNLVNARYGHIETYLAKGRNGKLYEYLRYVYCVSGIYKHHHISQKQTEAITALWHSGASAKEIVTAIGKKYLGKDSP